MEIRLIVYFFSNHLLITVGFIFILPLFYETKEGYDNVKRIIFGNLLHVILGFFGLIVLGMNLFFPMDSLIMVGDLVPCIVLLVISVILLFGYVRVNKYLTTTMIKKGESILTSLQIPIGFLALLVGLVHIVFGNIIFL